MIDSGSSDRKWGLLEERATEGELGIIVLSHCRVGLPYMYRGCTFLSHAYHGDYLGQLYNEIMLYNWRNTCYIQTLARLWL